MAGAAVAALVVSTLEVEAAASLIFAGVTGASWAVSTAVGAAVAGGASYLISSGVNSLLGSGGGGDAPASFTPTSSDTNFFTAQANTRTHILRTTIANRQIVYGQAMLSGPLVFAHSNDNYGTLHLVIALANHECEEIGAVYFNDESLGTLDASGYPTGGRYYLPVVPGGNITYAEAINQPCVYNQLVWAYITLPYTPYQIVSITDSDGGTWSATSWDGVSGGMGKNAPNEPGCGYLPLRQYAINGNVIKLSPYVGTVTVTYSLASGQKSYFARIRKHLGAWNQSADSELVALGAGWTTDHRLSGVAYIVASMVYDAEKYPRGIPNIKAIVKGKKLYDPRTGLTVWSDNPALVARDYLTAAYGLGCASSEIDDASFIVAANACDGLVTQADGSSQKRYTCNGVIDMGQRPTDILRAMVSSCAGTLVWQGGTWRMHAGAYSAPVGDTLTIDDLRAPLRVEPRVSRDQLFNAVKGTYIDPARGWLPQDYPAQRNSTYQTQDGGEEIFADMTLPMTTANAMAQRLAKIALERARQGIVVRWPGKPKLLAVAVGDTKRITVAHLGWTAKEFRVVDWQLDPTGAVDLVLQEEASASYNWNAGMQTVTDPAPDTALPDPFNVPPPQNLAIFSGTEELLRLGDGTIVSRMFAAWDPAPAGIGRTDLRYRRVTDVVWQDMANVLGSSSWITPVDDAATYLVQVRFSSALGYSSPWTSLEHTVVGKTAPPSNVQSFMIEGDTLSWSPVSDIDLAGYRIRYNSGSINTSWGTANALHAGLITDSPYTMLVRPAGPVVLMVKAVDTSGNESLDIAAIFTDLGDPVVANVVESFDYHAGAFPGAMTSCSIEGGSDDLVADSATTFWATNSSVSMWVADSGALMWGTAVYAAMFYEFSFEPVATAVGYGLTLPATIYGSAWSISYRQRGINLMWGGSSAAMWSSDDAMWSSDSMQPMWINESSAMWKTTGDMWTAPAFSPWPGSVTAQRDIYDFRIDIAFGSPQGRISALTAQVDVPDRQESFSDVAVPDYGMRLPIGSGWFSVTNVNLTLQDDGGSAYTAKIIDKSASLGPLVKVFNSSGTAVAGVLDAIVQGY